MIELTDDSHLDEILSDTHKLVFLDFYANWCGPCKRLTPNIVTLEKEYPECKFVKIDVDSFPEISEKYSITCMPTLIFIRNNEILRRIEGANLDEIRDALVKLR